MKKYINYFLVSVIIALGCVATSCKDDETTLSRAVLASTDVLEYEGIPSGPQIITITSDADWVCEAPEWVTVSPASGHAGQTEVEITVADNIRDRDLDNPRKASVLFKGRNLESIATVIIRQNGDKFRDPIDYTIEAMEAAEDETVVRLPNMIVTALTGNGFIATDGTNYVYVKEPVIAVETGQKVSIIGEKFTDNMKMAYVLGEKISDEGSAVIPEKTPVDITETVDEIKGNKYRYVSVTGSYNGTAVEIKGKANKVYTVDAADQLGMSQYIGHNINVTGYYAGAASPVVNIIPTAVEDLGLDVVLLFFEDFEWIEPWAQAGKDGSTPAGNTVGTNGKTSEAPKADACKYNGKTAYDELIDRGYDFVSAHEFNDKDGKRDFALYLQQNYLKFNKTGNVNGKPYQEGLVLPAIDNIPDNVALKISFDWCPQQQGDGMFDKTEMAVIIVNGEVSTEFKAPVHTWPDSSAYSWTTADIDLSGAKITKDTKIIIRNTDDAWAQKTAHRFYIDNIKIYYQN